MRKPIRDLDDGYLDITFKCGCPICESNMTCSNCRHSCESAGLTVCIEKLIRETSLQYRHCEYEVRPSQPACHFFEAKDEEK